MKHLVLIIFLFASCSDKSKSYRIEWDQIFSMIRQNGKMTGIQIENTIEYLTKNLQAVEPKKKQ